MTEQSKRPPHTKGDMSQPQVSSDDNATGLAHAPDDIKLAVDLIYLLESNNIDPQTALRAIEIVRYDLEKRMCHK